jgi:alpha-glucosidase (family GH31 glycosyl hydrolase)
VRWTDASGATVLEQRGVAGVDGLRREGQGAVFTLRTAGGRTARVELAPAGDGVIRMRAALDELAFAAERGERFVGFGERSHAVDGAGREIENYVSDGPYRPEDRRYVKASAPPWGDRDRDDATYFPIPWALSSRGVGVLLDNDETSVFRFGEAEWTAAVEAPAIELRVFAGPTPADALRRFTAAVGRQPPPATPWSFGPWFQTGQPNVVPLEDERRFIDALRQYDAPVSAAETQMHYLPCGAHRGNEDYERRRNEQFHAAGLAHLAYFNPHVCQSYEPVYSQAAREGVLQRTPVLGTPFTYPAFVGGSGPAGFTQEPLAQFDFTAPGAEAFYERLVREAFDAGKDGWMEDFGEYTPPTAESADGTPGTRMHNRYPTSYHCAAHAIARRLPRPVSRHQRSGWTGSAACADIVWGGDPTTVWDYDGLQSVTTQALSMGLSGVSRWGTDIGGYHSFGPRERLTPEMLRRWIQVGAVSAVMRTKRSGIAIPSYERPQVFGPDLLAVWRRYAKLHTQLNPYLLAADRVYRETGMPIMRHHLLTHPGDPRAAGRDDQFLFGPDLLAAPVTAEGVRERALYAPAGTWVDFWRSVAYRDRDGAFVPRAARLLEGGREHTLPAPEHELPLLVRAGAVLPMLAADVDTLAPYDGDGVVTAAERDGRMTLLAFPRGRSAAGMGEQGRLRSIGGRRRWRLEIDGERVRTYTIRAALGVLRRPFRPRRVLVAGRRLRRSRWSYDRATRVVTIRARLRHGAVVVARR